MFKRRCPMDCGCEHTEETHRRIQPHHQMEDQLRFFAPLRENPMAGRPAPGRLIENMTTGGKVALILVMLFVVLPGLVGLYMFVIRPMMKKRKLMKMSGQ